MRGVGCKAGLDKTGWSQDPAAAARSPGGFTFQQRGLLQRPASPSEPATSWDLLQLWVQGHTRLRVLYISALATGSITSENYTVGLWACSFACCGRKPEGLSLVWLTLTYHTVLASSTQCKHLP